MKLVETLKEGGQDRAVSPVLGVALLIAITVILAGVVGFIVLGVDTGGPDTPNAQLQFSENNSVDANGEVGIDVTHEGGDKLVADDISVVITNNGTDTDAGSFDTDMTAGDTQPIIIDGTDGVEENDVVRLVWDDPNSDKTSVLGEYTVEGE